MPTINMSEALQEALATARTDAFEYYTFEFVHPAWETPVYVVYGWDVIDALIETPSDGPSAGQVVTFQPLPIEFTMPATTSEEIPSFEFKFYDPSRIVMQKVFESQADPRSIQMYIRVYLSNRLLLGPETVPPPRYHVATIRIEESTSMITGRCVFQDYMGRSVPFRTYTLAEFPGLRRR